MRRTIQMLFALTAATFLAASCTEKEEALNPSLFAHLHRDSLLHLTLEADWQTLVEHKHADLAVPAVLLWQDTAEKQQITAELSVRGKARRNICGFPPLKLKFSEENLEKLGLNGGYKSLKLVTHCLTGNDDLVLREYLTYKMLNTLTDQSFRVQLAKVTYQSPQGSIENYAFLIENNEEMATRLGGNLLEEEVRNLKTINAEQYNVMTVFQYMIGNTDWNMAKQHNIKLVQLDDQAAPLPVPYDFDYSGIVNAAYALPPAQLPIKSVQERYFQWRGTNSAALEATLEKFKTKKDALYQLVQTFEPLSLESRQEMLRYLDSFYQNMPAAPRLASR